MGCARPGAVLRVGVHRHGPPVVDHGDELVSTFWIASRIPIGLIGNTSRAVLSRTTVGFFSPSIKCRPTSKLAGVTRASHRLDKYGVSTGTEISHRRSPFCRAYSRIIPP